MPDVPASTLSGAVFLSYAREDSAAVQCLAEALRGGGVEVWFDQNELVGGDAWDAKIRGQIATCALFVPVISANTQGRREGYFRLEWRLAAQRSHMMSERAAFLLPIMIDATREAEADVPAEFKAVQWTRLADGALPPQSIERIKRLLAPADEVARVSRLVSAEPTGQETRATSGRSRRRWIWPVAAAAVVAIAAGLFFVVRKPAVIDKSIAVLPFANLGADKNDEYLGDGMTEELLNVFAKVPKLKVAARTSSFSFKGKNLPISDVGKQLGVAFVLEGSVRKAGNKLRITTQLINVTDGYHLWSETYDRDMTDLLAIQTEVSQQVVKALLGRLGVEESRALTKRGTENPEAHRLYLLGRFYLDKATETSGAEAFRCFTEALKLDPSYAFAHSGIADVYDVAGANVIPGREAWAKQMEAAQKAIELDPNLAEAHLSLGLALSRRYELLAAERAMRRALDLNPRLGAAHDQLSWILLATGREDPEAARRWKSSELEPTSVAFANSHAVYLYFSRRYEAGLAQARRAIAMDANFANAHNIAGACLTILGRFAAAEEEFGLMEKIESAPFSRAVHGWALGRAGNRSGAEQILAELEELAKRRLVSAGCRVLLYVGMGEKQKALEWLERAAEDQDWFCWQMRIDPALDPLRDDPRFKALLKKVGLDK